MSHINIKKGLCRLEFSTPTCHEVGSGSGEVLVEFVRGAPFADEETVRIPLGRRGAVLRALSGRPLLVRTDTLGDGSRQYTYRISGPIECYEHQGL